MAIYYISDTHFNHNAIISYCDRQFSTAEEMNNYMIEKWNSIVSPEDTIIHIGDVSMGSQFDRVKILSNLNGKKILVAGNHDYKKLFTHANIFEEIVDYIYQDDLLIIHDPYEINSNYNRVNGFTLKERYDSCKYLLHGHVHNSFDVTLDFEKSINCCVELHDYTPKTIEQLIEWKNTATDIKYRYTLQNGLLIPTMEQ